jgi:hypothetical protein
MTHADVEALEKSINDPAGTNEILTITDETVLQKAEQYDLIVEALELPEHHHEDIPKIVSNLLIFWQQNS